MDKPTSLFLTLKGILAVGFTGLGIVCLSTLEGLTGIVLAFFCIYLAFFTSTVFHRISR